jgi:subtilisin family serine protease
LLVAGQLLIGFLPTLDEAARDVLVAAHGGETIARLDRLAARVVAVRGDRPLGEVARGFATAPGVRYAEPNTVQHVAAAPTDPRLGEQWALTKIGAPEAWETTTGDRGIVVGVVDSGVAYDHPDLAANMWSAPADGRYQPIGPLNSVPPAHTATVQSRAQKAATRMMTRVTGRTSPGLSARKATMGLASAASTSVSASWP